MQVRGLGMPEPGEVTIKGQDPVFPNPFKIGEATANAIAAVGVAVTDIQEMKTGRRQNVEVDVRHAAATCIGSKLIRTRGPSGSWDLFSTREMNHMRTLTHPWLCKDGRWFMPHFNLPHLHDRVIEVLKCESNAESVSKAISEWDSLDLEEAIAEAGACGSVVRSNAEWLRHPHGAMLAKRPVLEVTKIGDSDPMPFNPDGRPLSGIRVLDLTRILAGPMAARTLAEHGADVLMVAAERLPQVPEHVLDTSHGKRSCFLDFDKSEDLATIRQLIKSTDVFSQGYRSGVMDHYGLSPEQLHEMRPGIVYISISCFGYGGPLSSRRGWEQISQATTGIVLDSGMDKPKLAPAAVCDYTTGNLAAYGALLALARRAREGGSYHVRVSLCQSGMFLYRMGKVAYDLTAALSEAEVESISMVSNTGYGELKHLAPVLRLSETQGCWDKPAPKLGSSAPAW
ncbi:CoA transferase [Verticiella sediminum]